MISWRRRKLTNAMIVFVRYKHMEEAERDLQERNRMTVSGLKLKVVFEKAVKSGNSVTKDRLRSQRGEGLVAEQVKQRAETTMKCLINWKKLASTLVLQVEGLRLAGTSVRNC